MNHLTPTQTERLSKALEETGEVQIELGNLQQQLGQTQQTLGKILLHGFHTSFESFVYDNKADLEREIGDFYAAVDLMVSRGDLDLTKIQEARLHKLGRNTKYMKHQTESTS